MNKEINILSEERDRLGIQAGEWKEKYDLANQLVANYAREWAIENKKCNKLRSLLEASTYLIIKLLSILPDSIHKDKECWNWCWNELNTEAQDTVKNIRNETEKVLTEIEKLK